MKIFGIGLSHTGTKSLCAALYELGYEVAHFPVNETYKEIMLGQYELNLLKGDSYSDGITDIIGATFYPEFDKTYPNSKFILTTRDKQDWLRAMDKHFQEYPYDENATEGSHFFRSAMYGCYTFNEMRFKHIYDTHHRNIYHYFKDRLEDLLTIDITAGDEWEELCKFLDKPIPSRRFPHRRDRANV